MFWNKRLNKIAQELTQIRVELDNSAFLRSLIALLQKQNDALFDKLMSRNWDQWGQTPSVAQRIGESDTGLTYVISPTQNEDNAGGILGDDDLKG